MSDSPSFDPSPAAPSAAAPRPLANWRSLAWLTAADGRLSDRVLAAFDRHRKLVFLAILLLYAAGFNAQWRPEPDSALYLSIGRNLAEGRGYTYHGKDHRLAFPGVPLLFAGLFRSAPNATGTDALMPHLVVMWLMGMACLGLVYRLFLLHAGRPTAVLVTFGVAISRVFYRYVFELLSDLPFLFGVLLFLVGYEAIFQKRTRNAPPDEGEIDVGRKPGELLVRRTERRTQWFDPVFLVLGLGIAVLTRPTMWALVAAAGLAMLWSLVRGKPRWGHVLVLALVVAAVAAFYLKDPRHQPHDAATPAAGTAYGEEDQLFQLRGEKLLELAKGAWPHLPETLEAVTKATFGQSVAFGMNYVLAVPVLVASLALVRRRPLWAAWVFSTFAIVLLVPKPIDRYFLAVVPVTVFAWWRFVCWAEGRFTGRAAAAVFFGLFGFGGVCNLIGTGDFIIEQRLMPFLQHYKDGRYASVEAVAKMLETYTPPSGEALDPRTTWVITPTKFGRILSFLSRRYCVEPELYSPLNPQVQNVYVLEPVEPLHRDPDDDRPPIRDWLAARGTELGPHPLAVAPNRNPNDGRPFKLYATQPLGWNSGR